MMHLFTNIKRNKNCCHYGDELLGSVTTIMFIEQRCGF